MQTSFKQIYSRYRGYFLNIISLYGKKPDVKKFLELFLNLIAVSVFSLFAIKPTIATIIGLIKEIKAKEDTISVMDEKIANLKNAQNLYYQNKVAIDILNLAIPTSPAPDLIARQIEAVTKINSISPNAITFSSTVIKGGDSAKKNKEETAGLPPKTRAIIVSLSGKSSYDTIKSFVTNLENMRRPFIVDSLSISKKTIVKEGDTGELSFSIIGRVPYYSTLPSPVVKVNENNKSE